MNTESAAIHLNLVKSLIQEQFPDYQQLAISPIPQSGWDNRSFRMGNEFLIRTP